MSGKIYDGSLRSSATFNLDQIEIFLAILEHGSISKAGISLGLSQPAVSQALKRIEIALDRCLFRRGKAGLTLTEDGAAYAIYAKAMARIGEDAVRHFSCPRQHRTLVIGLTEDFSMTYLPRTLYNFHREFPLFSFRIECDLSDKLDARYRAGEFDLIVRKAIGEQNAGVIVQKSPIIWVGRQAADGPLDNPLKLVLLPPSSFLTVHVLECLQRHGRRWEVSVQSGSIATMHSAVEAGLGIAAAGRSIHGACVVPIGPLGDLPDLGVMDILVEHRGGLGREELHAFSRMFHEILAASSVDIAEAKAS